LTELRILLFQRALYNYHAVMYLKKEIIISFFITSISASNLYMPMIWLYVFLLDFLIPFLCDPDLQCALEQSIRLRDSRLNQLTFKTYSICRISCFGAIHISQGFTADLANLSELPFEPAALDQSMCHRIYS
jgi:hypothetical protein